jgi:formylglycine-generating enzyme required for sulfatase activity
MNPFSRERKPVGRRTVMAAFFVLTVMVGRRQTPAPAPDAAAPTPPPAAARTTAIPQSLADFATKFLADTGIKLIPIPAGEFTMGDMITAPPHRVTISHLFFLGATDVTQAQWTAVMGNNPAHFKGDTRPVEMVSWDDTMAFCKKLTEQEQAAGRLPAVWKFSLPTSAQWEYACRAGTTGDYAGEVDAMAWYDTNSDDMTHPVAQKQPNPWGLYDMHGNVYQWCLDWTGSYTDEAETDPTGPATGSNRVMRGGAWDVGAPQCRSAGRVGDDHRSRFYSLGFRLALVTTPIAAPPTK